MKRSMRKWLAAAGCIAALGALPGTAAADSYPSKPVKVVVPMAAQEFDRPRSPVTRLERVVRRAISPS